MDHRHHRYRRRLQNVYADLPLRPLKVRPVPYSPTCNVALGHGALGTTFSSSVANSSPFFFLHPYIFVRIAESNPILHAAATPRTGIVICLSVRALSLLSFTVMDVLIFPLLVVSHSIAVFGQKQCFLSDGTLVTNEVPCDPDAAVSACCYKTSFCISNFYCWAGLGTNRVPGACTDSTWEDPACGCPCKLTSPQINLFVNSLHVFPATQLNSLNSWCIRADSLQTFNTSVTPEECATGDYSCATNCGDGTICCGAENVSCCDNHEGRAPILYPFDNPLQDPEFMFSLTAIVTPSSSSLSSTIAPGGASSSSSSTSVTTTSSSSLLSSTSIPPSQSPSGGLSTGAEAGIAVGAAVVALSVMAALWVVCRKRRKRLSAREPNNALNNAEPTRQFSMRKPELEGSRGLVTSSPISKLEPAATTITQIPASSASVPQKTNFSAQIPITAGASQSEKQVLERKRVPPYLPEPVEDHTHGETSVQRSTRPPAKESTKQLEETFPKYIVDSPATAPASSSGTTATDINVMKAQEREMAEVIAANESVQRLRAEHAALVDRIRMAELKAQELNRG